MGITYQTFTTIAGSLTIIVLVILVRKAKLHALYVFWWLCVIVGLFVLSVFPRLVDEIGAIFGVSYPPIIVCVLGLLVILVKVLSMDIYITKNEIRYRKLAQKMAVLEKELEDLNKRAGE